MEFFTMDNRDHTLLEETKRDLLLNGVNESIVDSLIEKIRKRLIIDKNKRLI